MARTQLHAFQSLGAVAAVLFVGAVAASGPQKKPATQKKPAAAPARSFETTVRPVVDKFCIKCHSGAEPIGGVRLDLAKNKAGMVREPDKWDKVAQAVLTGVMPPKGRPAPTPQQRKAFAEWIQATLASECDVKTPGRVTMRRLNRLEYDNTVRDLVGLDLGLAQDFPSDDVGYGFDNIGDVLSISPLLMEKYLKAAEKIATAAIVVPNDKPIRLDNLKSTQGANPAPDLEWVMFTNSEVYADYLVRIPGRHKLSVTAYGQQAGPEAPKLEFRVDGKPVRTVDVTAVRRKPEKYEVEVDLRQGTHRLGVAFLNDFYEAGPPAKDRNVYLLGMELVRPSGTLEDMPESHRRIIFAQPTEANRDQVARTMLSRFATRAFRRPAESTEVDRLLQLAQMAWKHGESFERGIQLGVQAVLSSPHFLFRVEVENGKALVGPYELASRLSYFLWSSMPDETLMRLAASGEILKPAVLAAQAKRMLKDPRAAALGEGFASQWLNLRKLAIVQPDPKLFPVYDAKLRHSMEQETRMFFDAVVREDRKVTDFLDGKFSFVDERLAKLYGIPGVQGDQFRKVSLVGTPRAGLLTQAAILTLTSNPTRTSPVKRGKWVLEQILNQPPPPPPPGVPDLKEDEPNAPEPQTIREKMKRHLKDPVCASCHTRMDPIGLSMENFDAIGRWRTSDGKAPIDASGELPDGTKFSGPTELRSLLLKQKDRFVSALAEKLLTFATGRGIESADKCFVEEIAKRTIKEDYKFSALVVGVVTSEPFRLRQIEEKKKK